jgi:hypothetical protein
VLDKAAAGLPLFPPHRVAATPTFAARRMQRLTSLPDRSRFKFSAGRHGHSKSQQSRRQGQARAFSRRMLGTPVDLWDFLGRGDFSPFWRETSPSLAIDAAIIAAYLAVLNA